MQEEINGAIVLAGGKSSRMGQDKAMLPCNGMTLLENTVAVLLNLITEVVIVTDQPGKYDIPCARIIADTFPDCGPVGGILTGLAQLGKGRHIVVACDMPYLNSNVLRLLMKAATEEWDAVVPGIGNQVEPLCAVYSHTACSKMLSYLEAGGGSAKGALDLMRVKYITEGILRRLDPNLLCFTNVNTPEEYAKLASGSSR